MTEKMNFVVTGAGLATVITDATLTGDGSAATPLGIAPAGVGLPQLNISGTAQDDYVIAYDVTNTRLYWKVDATASRRAAG